MKRPRIQGRNVVTLLVTVDELERLARRARDLWERAKPGDSLELDTISGPDTELRIGIDKLRMTGGGGHGGSGDGIRSGGGGDG